MEHSPIAFPNYPSEWAPTMLHAAGGLCLDLAERSLREGFVLKDATPFNIMFDGARPVFLDLLSFQRQSQLELVWRPYAQFVQTILYPLLACRYLGMRLDEIFTVNREGLETGRMRRLLPVWRLLTPPFFELVTVPSLRLTGSYMPRPVADPQEAQYIQLGLFGHLRRLLRNVTGAARTKTGVAQYADQDCPYEATAFAAKEQFVSDALQRYHPREVLDVGCNTGHFSLMAAACGASVVAIDRDTESIGLLWGKARANSATVLPLVVDLARPTPAMGWENGETDSFLDRARGRFDCVLMLALLHHLMVTERIPLERIFQLAEELTTNLLIVEFVSPQDPQFALLARGREALYQDVSLPSFEAAAGRHYEILERAAISATREIFTLKKKVH